MMRLVDVNHGMAPAHEFLQSCSEINTSRSEGTNGSCQTILQVSHLALVSSLLKKVYEAFQSQKKSHRVVKGLGSTPWEKDSEQAGQEKVLRAMTSEHCTPLFGRESVSL